MTRDMNDKQQAQGMAELQQQAADEVQRTKSSLAEVEHGLSVARADSAIHAQEISEKRNSLEQELSHLTAELDREKREYERKIQAERNTCQSLKDSFDKLRNEQRSSYKAAFEGPVHQISALEGTISEIQRNSDAELTGLRQRSEKLRVRIEDFETELARLQAKLQQT